MPGPAIYVVAIIGAVAASLAFKEFVYEPHIAPKIEQWAEGFLAKRQARRRRSTAANPVAAVPPHGEDEEAFLPRTDKKYRSDDDGSEMRQSIELENLVAKEVREWRSEVDRSQTHGRGLRRRGNVGRSTSSALDEPNHHIPPVPLSPTQIVSKSPSTNETATESYGSSRNTPLRDETRIQATLPTPDATSISSPDPLPHRPLSSNSIPSLSQFYPLELDQEHGLELLSAPSSRGESPFSNFSHPLPARETTMTAPSSDMTNFLSLASVGATSPAGRPPSGPLSDLDFFSDIGDHELVDVMSPRSVVSDVSTFDDDMRSERSGSSWASGTDARSQ